LSISAASHTSSSQANTPPVQDNKTPGDMSPVAIFCHPLFCLHALLSCWTVSRWLGEDKVFTS
jgi:hypothetical protein